MTPENVVEEMFCDPPPSVPVPSPLATSLTVEPAQLELSIEGNIIRENRSNGHLRSQLQKILEEAAPGERSDFDAFSACFNALSTAFGFGYSFTFSQLPINCPIYRATSSQRERE